EIKNGSPRLIHVDHLVTDSTATDSERYEYVRAFAAQLAYEHRPFDDIAREKFNKDGSKRSTQLVFGAWSAIDMALGSFGYSLDDKDQILASRVKKYSAGKDGARKHHVAAGGIDIVGEEVRPLLYTDRGLLIDDRADAIATGLPWAMRKALLAND